MQNTTKLQLGSSLGDRDVRSRSPSYGQSGTCAVEVHIDTKSRIDIIAIFLFCIDIFNRYIGICKSFHQVINFSTQSQKCECLHSHTMQTDRQTERETHRERQRERERDVHDFLVNP